jgi:hypothetical protein
MEVTTWNGMTTLIANKILPIQYSDLTDRYDIFAPESQTFLWHISILKGGADATDFETSYKPTANAPMMINGALPVSPDVKESQLFTDEAIRDTAAHNSVVEANSGYRYKTIIIENGLNQIVSIQFQGSRNGSTWILTGGPWDIAASANDYASCSTYFPFMRCVATCAVAPASGVLNVYLEKMGN